MTGTGPLLRGLVCEDDAVIRRAVVAVMERCGFEVSVVATGQEAVQSAARTRPQTAVLDLALTGFRGVNVVADVVRAAPRCNLVVVSPFSALRSRVLAAGAFAVCDPSDLRQLRLCLKHALDHAEGSPGACDCHRSASLWPAAGSRPSLFWTTTTGGSWVAHYQPWSPN